MMSLCFPHHIIWCGKLLSDTQQSSFQDSDRIIESYYRNVITSFENKEQIVFAATIVPGSENDSEKDYITRFQELDWDDYFSGMAKLMLSIEQ